MSRAPGKRFNSGRWSFVIPASAPEFASDARAELVENVVAALEGGRGAPFHRSRHATTWKVRIVRSTGEPTNLFVKQIDTARGLVSRAKAKSRVKRSEHVLRISEDLRRHNFGVPSVPLIGENRDTGDEVVVVNEAPGFQLPRWLNPKHHIAVTLRHRILRQLGAEIARLHLAGYIHGDLSPYNILANDDHQIAITFIDHEGTEKTSRVSINVPRKRMRNLVQLGHFDFPGVSRTDKLRVFASYAAVAGLTRRASRQSLGRLVKMIARRRKRDLAIKHAATQPAIIAQRGAHRG
jgi:serine/threonine protein kinase